ncbi:unnamed protein product [Durusdinium trenchii]|uniref:Tyrosine-protein kinase ephrin type A/B receptor-like domain-containing protein n=1 Tax=Durusdinium trenchii TaxID=1381693 RepID=A0ABP0RAQ9_9DINO
MKARTPVRDDFVWAPPSFLRRNKRKHCDPGTKKRSQPPRAKEKLRGASTVQLEEIEDQNEYLQLCAKALSNPEDRQKAVEAVKELLRAGANPEAEMEDEDDTAMDFLAKDVDVITECIVSGVCQETLLPCLLLGEGEKFTKGVEDLMQDAELFDEEANRKSKTQLGCRSSGLLGEDGGTKETTWLEARLREKLRPILAPRVCAPPVEEKCFAVSKFYVSLEKQNLLRAPPVQAKLQVLPISGDVACNRRVLEAVAQTANEETLASDTVESIVEAAWLQHRASTLLEILLSVTNALLLCVVSYECHNFTGSRWALWAAAASTAKEAIQILPVMWRELSLNLLPDIIYVGAGVLALVPRMGAQALEELPCGPSMALLCSLSWLRLLFAMRGERWLGPRFLPIMFALRDTFAFFLVALLCLTASAHAYYVLNARGTDPFPVYSSITQTLRLGMFGDFDLFEFQGQDTTFHRSGSVSGSVWEPVDPTPQELGLEQYVYIQVVFYLTGIGITILLMNLLIGVLGQNYELYQDQAPQLFTRARAAMLLKHQDRPWFILAGWLQPWRSCDESSRPECWIRVLVSPLHLALGESGKFLVAQNFQLFFKANLFYKLLILLFAPIFLIGGFSLSLFVLCASLFFRPEGLQYLNRVAFLGCFGNERELDLGLGPSITSQLRAPKHAHRPEALHPGWAHRLAAVAEVMGRVPSLVGWREMVLYVDLATDSKKDVRKLKRDVQNVKSHLQKKMDHKLDSLMKMMEIQRQSSKDDLARARGPLAVAVGRRKNLSNDGVSYPVGIFLVNYAAQYATAEMVSILLQERLGYNVEKMMDGGFTNDAFFALAGCAQPTNSSDRGCFKGMITRAHVSVEGWTSGYQPDWDKLQHDFPAEAPRNLGNMGYTGGASMFIAAAVQEEAHRREGLSLDFYRDYNVSWHDPSRYFTSPDQIDKNRLLPCTETILMNSRLMQLYHEFTGDDEGVIVRGSGDVIGKCFDGYFWLAPGCRSNSSKCITFITGGSGWSGNEHMQKAAFLSMPLAWTVGKTWNDFTTLPMDYTTMFYWWTPDTTFLRLDAKSLIFPPHDWREFERGMLRSTATSISIDKYISQDLNRLAPEIEELMMAYMVDLKDVNDIMLDELETGDSYFDTACRWLRGNSDRWVKWLPDKTKCFARYGLYHENKDVFVSNRSDPRGLTCKICPSGHFSEPIEDLNGTTFVCQPCAAGKYQASKASTECEPCGKGEYQDQIGRSSCQRCGFGEYQDVPGQSSCIACPSQTSTVGFGSVSMADCGCLERTINVASSNSAFDCRSCSVGLKCPFGSTLQSLRTGQVPDGSSLSAEYVPQVLEGYYAEQEEPLVLYTCKPATNCPGGKPGECAGGLLDKPCSVCAEGKAWNGQECTECGDVAIFVWAFGLLLSLVVLLQAYDFVASHSTAEATSFQACAFAFGIAANMVQSLAIFGLMSMTWTSSVSSTTNFLRVALLDLDQLGFGHLDGLGAALEVLQDFQYHGSCWPLGAEVVVVAGFFILCLVAVLQMPRWSVKHHRERVQAFTFLTNKFRFNVWWFGMALLARGFALSVTVVVGSDVPELQVALASVILLLYLCVLVRFWPWKASILNYADAAVCSCLLLLINLSRDASLPSTIFTDDFSMVMLCLLAAFVATTGILCVSALILSKCKNGGAGQSLLLNFSQPNVTKISKAVQDTAKELLQIEAGHLEDALSTMNTYDLEALTNTITLVSMDSCSFLTVSLMVVSITASPCAWPVE